VPVLPTVEGVLVPAVSYVCTVLDVTTVGVRCGTTGTGWIIGRAITITVLIAVIADGSVSTIDILRVVTPDVSGVIQEVICASEVISITSQTVPVLPTVEGVLVPAIRHVCTVLDVPTVIVRCGTAGTGWVIGRAITITVLIAVIADRSVSTIDILGVVTPDVSRVIQEVICASEVISITS